MNIIDTSSSPLIANEEEMIKNIPLLKLGLLITYCQKVSLQMLYFKALPQ